MGTKIGYGREAALSQYREWLAWLPNNVGRRNDNLLGLCNFGVRAGLTDTQMVIEIISASGTPPLNAREVCRAIATARNNPYPSPVHGRQKPVFNVPNWRQSPEPLSPPLGSGAASFVDNMIKGGEGVEPQLLIEASPVPIPPEPWKQTACFLEAMYEDSDYLFCGEQNRSGVLGQSVRMKKEWCQIIARDQKTLPFPLLIANPLTGQPALTKAGKPSLRCTASVKRHRYALVEFDAMPLKEQCAFWAGVIATKMLPLRSLVYSGNKSLHGLVEIEAADRAQWDKQIEVLLFATCNPNAPKDRQADHACRNLDRMTRLAGAWRADKKKRQRLLWLAAPR
ncbi:MAG: hypothetical protein WC340_04375 [Kiritimatiellia bacterium]